MRRLRPMSEVPSDIRSASPENEPDLGPAEHRRHLRHRQTQRCHDRYHKLTTSSGIPPTSGSFAYDLNENLSWNAHSPWGLRACGLASTALVCGIEIANHLSN
jgi:hypothetical protein